MKAKDFLKEDKESDIHPYMKAALCGVVTVDGMDQFYEYYRFMTMVAGSPDNMAPKSNVLRDNPIAVAYTEADKDKINSALKAMGKTGTWVNSVASQEPADTNKVSPVAKYVPTKRGI